jgi:hypothetical protein
VREAFNDTVAPELNRIDLTIRNSHRLLRGKLLSDVGIDVGLISIGLFAGFINPTVATISTTLGGANFLRDVLKGLRDASELPAETRSSNLFFLWKLRSERDPK